MIAKGTTHNNGAKLAAYMTTAKPGERAELWQLRGFASGNIKDALRSVHVIADATHCEKPLFHVQVRNPQGESLTREQWERVADRIESKLGYSDQPRAIAFHRDEETGHEHMHIAWSRIDADSMTAHPLPFFKLRLKEVCRELEAELDLTRVSSQRDSPVRAATRDQDEQARRLGVDIREVRQIIRDCWERSDNGDSFRAALADEGLALAKGDRRDYVVIDHEGGMHALGKRLLGTTAAETRARMVDIDRDNLPAVEEARERLGMRREAQIHPTVAAETLAPAKTAQPDHELSETAGDIAPAYPLPVSGLALTSDTASHANSGEIEPVAASATGTMDFLRNEITVIAGDALESAPGELAGALKGLMGDVRTAMNIVGGITAIFGDDKPAPPPTKEIAAAQKQDRLANAERLLHDREYRRRLQQEEDKQKRIETARNREDDDDRARQR